MSIRNGITPSETIDQNESTDAESHSTNSLAQSAVSSLRVITQDRTVSPITAKAKLTEMNIEHDSDNSFIVTTNTGEFAVDLQSIDCTCDSTLPSRNKSCEHIEHVNIALKESSMHVDCVNNTVPAQHSDTRAVTETPSSMGDESVTDSPNTIDAQTPVCCDECGAEIGPVETSPFEIAYKSCNPCALRNTDLYHFNTGLSERDDKLVLFDRLLTNTNITSYHHNGSQMPVFDFFADHTTVSPSDGVVIVHERIDEDNCTGMVFQEKTVAVPNTTLSQAQEKLHNPPTSD